MIIKCGNSFFLQGKNLTYALKIDEKGRIYHVHFGRKIRPGDYDLHQYSKRGWSAQDINKKEADKIPVNDVGWSPKDQDGRSLDELPQEYPSYGSLDLRLPAVEMEFGNGSRILEAKYVGYEIARGKPLPKGMPGIRDDQREGETLKLFLEDIYGVSLELIYSVFDQEDIICRHVNIKNQGKEPFLLTQAFSCNLDVITGGINYDLVYFPGAWGRERHVWRRRITPGIFQVSNRRGGSGHQMNPFVLLCQEDTTEDGGDAWGCSLVYSGNHCSRVEMDQYDMLRLQIGIAPETFGWRLMPGETFATPECVLAFSKQGLQGVSQVFHKAVRERILPPWWKTRCRPVLLNSWEAVYFDFTQDKLVHMAQKAKEAGIELFVLDDGWFGKRDNDRCSLGDWTVNYNKLPDGIQGLGNKIHELGLQFGLWMEPEMVSPDSRLYRTHPDWIVRVSGRNPAVTRHQYVLDLTRPQVRAYIVDCVKSLLDTNVIDYVKWDMNRHLTDMPDSGYAHGYILGLYQILDEIVRAYPKILFESCSGGGGRFDLGLLYYMPQIWTSDDSDAMERMEIQYGTSCGYPPCTMGAHVSAVPNHQTGRVTSLKARGETAYMGVFGYELDLTRVTGEELEEIKEQVAFYKGIRHLLVDGIFYRLRNPFTSNVCAWELAAPDKGECCVYAGSKRSVPNPCLTIIYLKGLEPDGIYQDQDTGRQYGGDELMYYGLKAEFEARDCSTRFWHFVLVSV